MKLEVGKEVFLVKDGSNSGRWARQHNLPPKTYKGTICKVGRKYFEVNIGEYGPFTIKFHNDSLREVTSYTPDYSLYENEEAYNVETVFLKMKQKIEDFCYRSSWASNVTQEDLQAVYNILEKYLPKE